MNIRERLAQIEQALAQHTQLAQQTQANIFKLEGAREMLREVLATEETAVQSAKVVPFERPKRRRRTKEQIKADKEQSDGYRYNGEADPAPA